MLTRTLPATIAAPSPSATLSRMLAMIVEADRRYRNRHALRMIPPGRLADMGITTDEAERAAGLR
jgi:uncharacterized protein YjiS (DUF1127 family)